MNPLDRSSSTLSSFYQNIEFSKEDPNSPFFFGVARSQLDEFLRILEELASANREVGPEFQQSLYTVFGPTNSFATLVFSPQQATVVHVERGMFPASLLRGVDSRMSRLTVTLREYFWLRFLMIFRRHCEAGNWRMYLFQIVDSLLGLIVTRFTGFAQKAFLIFESVLVFDLEPTGEENSFEILTLTDTILSAIVSYAHRYVEFLRFCSAQKHRSTGLPPFVKVIKIFSEKMTRLLRVVLDLAQKRIVNWEEFHFLFLSLMDPSGEFYNSEFLSEYVGHCRPIFEDMFPRYLTYCCGYGPFEGIKEAAIFDKIVSSYQLRVIALRPVDPKARLPPLESFSETIRGVLAFWSTTLATQELRQHLIRVSELSGLKSYLPKFEADLESTLILSTQKSESLYSKSKDGPFIDWNVPLDPSNENKFAFFVALYLSIALDFITGKTPSSGPSEGEYVFNNGILVRCKNPLLGSAKAPNTNLRFLAKHSSLKAAIAILLSAFVLSRIFA